MTQFRNARPQTAVLMLTTCNDLRIAEASYESLKHSHELRYRWGFLVIDSGSTDGTVEFFQKRHEKVYGPHTPDFYPTEHLCQALNAGIKTILGYDPDENEFKHLDYCGYIGWVHADMEFPQLGWLEKLVEICEKNSDYGKLSPDDIGLPPAAEDRPGNSCPWIMPVSALMALWEKTGTFFDEEYLFTQSYDDWDLNRSLIGLNYKVMITPHVRIKHEGMGTRKDHKDQKYQEAYFKNKQHYKQKWGDLKCPV